GLFRGRRRGDARRLRAAHGGDEDQSKFPAAPEAVEVAHVGFSKEQLQLTMRGELMRHREQRRLKTGCTRRWRCYSPPSGESPAGPGAAGTASRFRTTRRELVPCPCSSVKRWSVKGMKWPTSIC